MYHNHTNDDNLRMHPLVVYLLSRVIARIRVDWKQEMQVCNHASPSVLWLCWNKGFSVLFVSSQAKLNNVRSYEWPRNCLQVIMIPSLSRTNSIWSSSIHLCMYMYNVVQGATTLRPEFTQYIIYIFLILQLAASKTQGVRSIIITITNICMYA